MSWLRRVVVAVLSVAVLVVPTAPATAQTTRTPSVECSDTYFQDDRRLGPSALPKRGIVGMQLIGYRRTGGLTTQQFLDTYWDPAASWWRYPPSDGYLIGPGGRPLITRTSLAPGQLMDRYGSEFGQFLAPMGTPYASRAIPPQSLVSTPAGYCNYRAYRVLRPFTVDSGPIASWFAQPGFGWQYQLKTGHVPGAPSPLTVKWLLENGYLLRIAGPPQSLRERGLPPADRAPSVEDRDQRGKLLSTIG
jgi:hypothetical protein